LTAAYLDDLAKMPLQASIFASWYNNGRKPTLVVFAAMPLTVPCTVCRIDDLAKLPLQANIFAS
jgi:hypothetical protein